MISPILPHLNDRNAELVIFDIGSRDCMQSIEFYSAFPNAKIYAFECNPNTLPLCRKNIENYKDRITLIEGAVCDYDGDITFYPINQQKTVTSWVDGNPGASSLFKSNNTYTVEKYVQDEVKTNCHRLDTVMKSHGINRVDVIWMDLQGAELLALKSLGNFIDSVDIIFTEISYKPIYTGQVMFPELNDFLTSSKFKVVNKLSLSGWQEDAIYKNTRMFDIVIPVGPNDRSVIAEQIKYTRANVIGYRNIYLVSYDPSFTSEGCLTIDEKIFPFNINTVAEAHRPDKRNGWYIQQLLKLYAGLVIPDIKPIYLVIDADTFFLKPTSFIQDGKCLYNYGSEYHMPYFLHMKRLHPSLYKMTSDKSGICHHMIFETKYIKEIIKMIEDLHKEKFYTVFLREVDIREYERSGASEYEIYFNYMLSAHKDSIQIRPLQWKNVKTMSESGNNDYISNHHYSRI